MKLLNEQLHLEFIEISNWRKFKDWSELLTGIGKGIPSRFSSVKKDKLQFRLRFDGWDVRTMVEENEIDEFIDCGKGLIERLSSSVDNFVIDFRFKKYECIFSKESLEKTMKGWSSGDIVVDHYNFDKVLQIIVSKKEYKDMLVYQAGGTYID